MAIVPLSLFFKLDLLRPKHFSCPSKFNIFSFATYLKSIVVAFQNYRSFHVMSSAHILCHLTCVPRRNIRWVIQLVLLVESFEFLCSLLFHWEIVLVVLMSARFFLAVLLFSCSVINSSTMSLSTGAHFLALLLNLMGLVVLVDCFGDGGVGGNGDGGC